MPDSEKKTDDKFQQTLKRMLRTPPDPKGGKQKAKPETKREKPAK